MKPVSLETLREEPDVTLLKLSGEIGMELVQGLSAAVEERRANGALHWVVDLSRADFLSSPAVGVLMGLRSKVVRKRGSVSLVSVGRDLSEKLGLMGVNSVIPSYPTLKDFLEKFRWDFKDACRTLHMTLPANLHAVSPMRHLVSALLVSKGFGREEALAMENIADELSNNAIEHSRPPDGKVDLNMTFNAAEVKLSVSSESRPLSKEERELLIDRYEHPWMDQESRRGRGIVLIKMLSTEVSCQVEANRVMVEVVKKRKKHE